MKDAIAQSLSQEKDKKGKIKEQKNQIKNENWKG